MEIPAISVEQMVEVDRLMIEKYGIQLIQMMENAGRSLAELSRGRFLEGDPVGRPVLVLAGSGGNGGGALVCARRLHSWGARILTVTTREVRSLTPVPAQQAGILAKMGVSMYQADAFPAEGPFDLIIDGLIGYSLKGAPREAAADLIRYANEQSAPVLALDVPSGVEAGTGLVHEPAIRAAATLTLALPKIGLLNDSARRQVGELYLADISVPPALYAAQGLDLEPGPLFARSGILRLR